MVKEHKMSMREHYGKSFVGERKDGRIFRGKVIDVWSWPSTDPERGELVVLKQDDDRIKSVYVKDLLSSWVGEALTT